MDQGVSLGQGVSLVQGVDGPYRADVHVVQGGGLQPLPQEVLLDTGLGLEDGHGDGSDRETTASRLQAEEAR